MKLILQEETEKTELNSLRSPLALLSPVQFQANELI